MVFIRKTIFMKKKQQQNKKEPEVSREFHGGFKIVYCFFLNIKTQGGVAFLVRMFKKIDFCFFYHPYFSIFATKKEQYFV